MDSLLGEETQRWLKSHAHWVEVFMSTGKHPVHADMWVYCSEILLLLLLLPSCDQDILENSLSRQLIDAVYILGATLLSTSSNSL